MMPVTVIAAPAGLSSRGMSDLVICLSGYAVLGLVAACLPAAGQERAEATMKVEALHDIRSEFAENRLYIHYSVRGSYTPANTSRWLERLQPNGRFSDLSMDGMDPGKYDGNMQKQLAGKLTEAFKRLRLLAQLTLEEGPHKGDDNLRRQIMLGTVHYGDIELRRIDGWFRFHASCFGIPRIVYGIYFAFFESMKAAEETGETDTLAAETSRVLQALMRQTFTQPERDDVANPYSADQFRDHVWWVGGNFAYRPVFAAAAVCNDARMLDVIAEVVSGSLSVVSANTLDTAFWTEGICADGAGWGHGRQCYVWGYPTHGVLSSLGLLQKLRGTPWAQAVSAGQLSLVADYIVGVSWYQYRGRQTLMSPGRSGFAAGPGGDSGVIGKLVDAVCQFEELSRHRMNELQSLKAQRQEGLVERFGTRVFWNNDDMIYRDPECTIGVNMSSARTQSNEVVPGAFSTHTDFFADGATFINRDGFEYAWAKGAWDCSAIPGTTVRKQELHPVKLWGGYRGVHSWAGGVHDGRDGGAAFVYEKAPTDGNPRPELYGVQAHKAYITLDGVLFALGAGIRNLNPDLDAPIRTTLDQPEWRGNIDVLQSGRAGTVFEPGSPVDLTLSPGGGESGIIVRHHGVTYSIPGEENQVPVRLVAGRRNTHWIERHGGNKRRENLPEQVAVMQLWLDHGGQPLSADRSDRYAYAVDATGRDRAVFDVYRIVSNTTRLQAVRRDDHRLIGMVAYDSEAVYDDGGLRITVDRPAVILLKRDGDMWRLTVADPLQETGLQAVTVQTNLELEGDEALSVQGGTRVRIPVPDEPYCGKPVTVILREM